MKYEIRKGRPFYVRFTRKDRRKSFKRKETRLEMITAGAAKERGKWQI